MDTNPPQSSMAADTGMRGAWRRRLRDRWLQVLAVLIVLSVITRLVAREYAADHFAHDCFPYCSFEQSLSKGVSWGAAMLVVVLVIAVVVRWVWLGRRSTEEN